MNIKNANMKSLNSYPLFSFLVICYNQENYIAEALLSALDQDYPNLEVIVSDDCSTDQTFEIAKKIAQKYEGPHKIILNRNSKNLGIGANFYKAYTFSSGEWLFMAAGDDISYRNRARIIYETLENWKNLYAIGSPREIIDKNGNSKGYCYWNQTIHGASAVWHRKLFSEFEPIPSGLMTEDTLLYFRALLLGNVYHSEYPNIKYRIYGSTLGNNESVDYKEKKQHALKRAMLRNNVVRTELENLRSIMKNRGCKYFDEIMELLKNRKHEVEIERESLQISVKILSSGHLESLKYILGSNNSNIHSKFLYRVFLVIMKFKWINRMLKLLRPNRFGVSLSNFSELRPDFRGTTYNIDDYLKKKTGIL